jgi:hypothetical protein
MDFFHNVFQTLGLFCSFLTFNLLFCLIASLLLDLRLLFIIYLFTFRKSVQDSKIHVDMDIVKYK